LSFIECIAFGSLLSSTDPVATLSIYSSLKVDPSLFYLVFGESVYCCYCYYYYYYYYYYYELLLLLKIPTKFLLKFFFSNFF
jgi:hypothetical protein